MKRRHLLACTLGALALRAKAVNAVNANHPLPALEVFKTATCGCCGAWVDHLKAAGFAVTVTTVDDTTGIRRKFGLPEHLGSCHTAVVAGYVVEGHVPAKDIRRLLALTPAAIGLAVPGMPAGSPGMEMGSRRDPYEVLLVDKQGKAQIFASYR